MGLLSILQSLTGHGLGRQRSAADDLPHFFCAIFGQRERNPVTSLSGMPSAPTRRRLETRRAHRYLWNPDIVPLQISHRTCSVYVYLSHYVKIMGYFREIGKILTPEHEKKRQNSMTFSKFEFILFFRNFCNELWHESNNYGTQNTFCFK